MRNDFRLTQCIPGFSLCLLIVSQFLLGCSGQDGPEIVAVKGVVSVDGKPVEGAEVSFRVVDGSRVSVGVTNDKGEYELTTFNTNDGAIVGDNQVSIQQTSKEVVASLATGLSPGDMQSGNKNVKGPDRSMEKSYKQNATKSTGVVPLKYGNFEKSGLKRTVVSGESNNFNFDLKP